MSLLALLPSRLVASAGIWDTWRSSIGIFSSFLEWFFCFPPSDCLSPASQFISHVLLKKSKLLPPAWGDIYIYYTYQRLAGNHSLVTKGTIHLLRILPICDMQVGYCAPNSWRNSVFSWCFFANKDCICLKRCLWDKFDRMRLATTPRSVCWRRVANGNALYTFSSVCPNDRSLPTSSATTRPSVHWKGVSKGRVLCSCSDLWKRLTSNQTWWATTAASLAATVLGSGKPPWTSLRRCNRRQFHQMLWWTSWCHFMPFQYIYITSLILLWTILNSKNSFFLVWLHTSLIRTRSKRFFTSWNLKGFSHPEIMVGTVLGTLSGTREMLSENDDVGFPVMVSIGI